MRKATILVALSAVVLALASCNKEDGAGDGKGKKGAGGGKKLTIAVIPKSTGNEFWEDVHKGANAAKDKYGVAMRWEGTLSETELAEQNKIIENMVNLGVKGMCLAPLNEKVMAKSVNRVVAAGIPVVIFDSDVATDKKVCFVATDNVKGGRLGAEELVRLLGGKKGSRIVVLRFIQGTMSTERRAEGCIDALKKAGFELLADPYPEGGAVEGAKIVATNTLQKYLKGKTLDVDGIFACNLIATLGMSAALDDLRKSGVAVNAKFVGFDTSPKLVKAVQDGKIDALVAQDPKKMGFLAVQTLVRHLNGEKVPKFIDTGVELVTKDKLANDKAIRDLVGLK